MREEFVELKNKYKKLQYKNCRNLKFTCNFLIFVKILPQLLKNVYLINILRCVIL